MTPPLWHHATCHNSIVTMHSIVDVGIGTDTAYLSRANTAFCLPWNRSMDGKSDQISEADCNLRMS